VGPATARDAIRRHPRHLILFALTTGLLLGPLSPIATVAAATLAAALAAVPPTPPIAEGLEECDAHAASAADPKPARSAAGAGGFEPPGGDRRVGFEPPGGDRRVGPRDRPAWTGAGSRPIEAADGDERVAGLHSSSAGTASVRLGVSLAAAAAVLVGAVVADVRIDAIEGGPLARMHGRVVETPSGWSRRLASLSRFSMNESHFECRHVSVPST
jgi:hypothetical protein